jgi:plasmid stability protein
MTDILIRDLPDEVIDALDARARELGLSRTEYVRRRLTQDAEASTSTVDVEDLRRFSQVFADLADPDVEAQAWR